MASGLYDNGVREIMRGNIDLINSPISALLIDVNEYTVDLATDIDLDDIPEAAIISESALTNKSLDGTTFRADDLTFISVEGNDIGAVVLFFSQDTNADSKLIAYLDNAPEFPITPDGTDIIISWDTGANGIFAF